MATDAYQVKGDYKHFATRNLAKQMVISTAAEALGPTVSTLPATCTSPGSAEAEDTGTCTDATAGHEHVDTGVGDTCTHGTSPDAHVTSGSGESVESGESKDYNRDSAAGAEAHVSSESTTCTSPITGVD